MKKFIVKVIVFALIIVSLLVVLNKYYVTVDTTAKGESKKFQNVETGIQISNTGSSHGVYSFYYDDLKQYKCFNFALSSQRLSYDYRVLLEFEDDLADGGIMFMPISYFSFYGVPETESSDFESKNQRYYLFLPPKLVKNYEFNKDLLYHHLPILNGPDNLQTIISTLTDKINPQTISAWRKDATEMDVHASAVAAHERHTSKSSYGGDMNPEEIDAVYDMISLCDKHSITPVLITTPFLREYTELFSDEFYSDFFGIINGIQADTGVLYYDYSNDARFAHDYTLFMNSDHLNMYGAKKFTSILNEEIINKIYGKQ